MVQQNIELQKTNLRAEEDKKKFKAIADGSPLALTVNGRADSKVQYVNPVFIRLFGDPPQVENTMVNWWQMTYPDPVYRQQIEQQWNKRTEEAIKTNKPIEPIETVVTCLDGTERNILWGFIPTGDENWTYGMDLTAFRLTEKELIASKERAEESNNLKTAFLQNMSHEIRTPMNAIMGFASLLPDFFGEIDKLKECTAIIEQRSSDLLSIIDDILDFSRIDSGQIPVNAQRFDVNELFLDLEEFALDYRKRIGKQHINLIMEKDSANSNCMIVSDRVKLRQILVNLISNAFKFTIDGKVTCSFRQKEKSMLFVVTDTGVGIPVDKQEFVFERFAQVRDPEVPNPGGTGLGLPIVKGLVQLLGGEIRMVSEPGNGTEFRFSIPFV